MSTEIAETVAERLRRVPGVKYAVAVAGPCGVAFAVEWSTYADGVGFDRWAEVRQALDVPGFTWSMDVEMIQGDSQVWASVEWR